MTDDQSIEAALAAVIAARDAVNAAHIANDADAIAQANAVFEARYAEHMALVHRLSGWEGRHNAG